MAIANTPKRRTRQLPWFSLATVELTFANSTRVVYDVVAIAICNIVVSIETHSTVDGYSIKPKEKLHNLFLDWSPINGT